MGFFLQCFFMVFLGNSLSDIFEKSTSLSWNVPITNIKYPVKSPPSPYLLSVTLSKIIRGKCGRVKDFILLTQSCTYYFQF